MNKSQIPLQSLVDFEQLPVTRSEGCEGDANASSVERQRRRQTPRRRCSDLSANQGCSGVAGRSRSRRRTPPGPLLTGASFARSSASSLPSSQGLLEDEEFDPALLEASLPRPASSLARPSMWRHGSREELGETFRHISPPRRAAQETMVPQLMPELYIDVVRRGRNSRFCLQCSQMFEIGQLQLGYTVDTLFPNQQARWIHVDCANDARLQIRAGSSRVSMNPHIPQIAQQDLLNLLTNLSARPGTTAIRTWKYLAASVKRWDAHVVCELQADGFNGQAIAGDNLSPKREREVCTILASIPSFPLNSDIGDDSPCAVCQVAMRQGDMVCRLPCHHMYHVGCIDSWLRVRTTCPLDNLCIIDMLERLSFEGVGPDDVTIVED